MATEAATAGLQEPLEVPFQCIPDADKSEVDGSTVGAPFLEQADSFADHIYASSFGGLVGMERPRFCSGAAATPNDAMLRLLTG